MGIGTLVTQMYEMEGQDLHSYLQRSGLVVSISLLEPLRYPSASRPLGCVVSRAVAVTSLLRHFQPPSDQQRATPLSFAMNSLV